MQVGANATRLLVIYMSQQGDSSCSVISPNRVMVNSCLGCSTGFKRQKEEAFLISVGPMSVVNITPSVVD